MHRPDDDSTNLTEALPPDVMAHPLGRQRSKRLAVGSALALAIAGVGAGFAGGAASASSSHSAGGLRILVPESQSGANSYGGDTTSGAPAAAAAVPCPVRKGAKTPAAAIASRGCSVGVGTTTGIYPARLSALATAKHLFTRTTAGGVTVRVYTQRLSAPTCLPSTTATAPAVMPICCGGGVASGGASRSAQPASSMTIYILDFSDTTAVGQGNLYDGETVAGSGGAGGSGGGSASASTSQLVRSITTGEFGAVEGSPAWWVAAAVGPSVTEAQVTFAGGATDSMAPVGGFVSLAGLLGPKAVASKLGPWLVRGTLKLLGSGGTVLATIDLAPSTAPVPVGLPSSPRTGPATGVSVGGSVTSGSTAAEPPAATSANGSATSANGSATSANGSATSANGSATPRTGKGGASPPEPVCPLMTPLPARASGGTASTGAASVAG